MTRLYVVAEGLTEWNFVTSVLKPHLEACSAGRPIISAPRLNGYTKYFKLRKLLRGLLRTPESQVVVTTMIDMFKLPGDFPGEKEARGLPSPLDRARYMEEQCLRDIGDNRFFPYLQVHEFEALLLTDLTALANQYPSRRKELMKLANRLGAFESPEHVNGQQPPSYRLRQVVPEYNKTVFGVTAASEIGLARLRERCRHFGEWLSRLESLAGKPRVDL